MPLPSKSCWFAWAGGRNRSKAKKCRAWFDLLEQEANKASDESYEVQLVRLEPSDLDPNKELAFSFRVEPYEGMTVQGMMASWCGLAKFQFMEFQSEFISGQEWNGFATWCSSSSSFASEQYVPQDLQDPALPRAVRALEPAPDTSECSICMGGGKPEPALKMPCGHVFCRNCLLGWLKRSCACPVCRSEIPGHRMLARASSGKRPKKGITYGSLEQAMDGCIGRVLVIVMDRGMIETLYRFDDRKIEEPEIGRSEMASATLHRFRSEGRGLVDEILILVKSPGGATWTSTVPDDAMLAMSEVERDTYVVQKPYQTFVS